MSGRQPPPSGPRNLKASAPARSTPSAHGRPPSNSMSVYGAGRSGPPPVIPPQMNIRGAHSNFSDPNQTPIGTGSRNRWSTINPPSGGGSHIGNSTSSTPSRPTTRVNNISASQQGHSARAPPLPEDYRNSAGSWGGEPKYSGREESEIMSFRNMPSNQTTWPVTGYPDDPEERTGIGPAPPQRRFYSGDASASAPTYPLTHGSYSIPNYVEPVPGEGHKSTIMMGYGQDYPLQSGSQHQKTPYPDTQSYSTYPQGPTPHGYPMSMMQVAPTTHVSAGSSTNRHLMETPPTQRGPANEPTDRSSTSQGSHARTVATDGPAKQPGGGIDVSAALSNLAEMWARSEQDTQSDVLGDEEEADGLEHMRSEMQPDANADEHATTERYVGAETEEPAIGDDQPNFDEDMQPTQDQEHPSSPAPPLNPPTPVFSPVVPLKSLENGDVDMATTPTQVARPLLPEASPPAQGLHLERIEDIVNEVAISGEVDMDRASRCSTPLTVLPSDLEEIQPEPKEPESQKPEVKELEPKEPESKDPEPNVSSLKLIPASERLTAQKATGKKGSKAPAKKAKGKVVQRTGIDTLVAAEAGVETHDSHVQPGAPSATVESGLVLSPPLDLNVELSEFSLRSRQSRSTRLTSKKEDIMLPQTESIDHSSPPRTHHVNGDSTIRRSNRNATKPRSPSLVATSLALPERSAENAQPEVLPLPSPNVALPPKPRQQKGPRVVEIIERQEADGTWVKVAEEGNILPQKEVQAVDEEVPRYTTQSGRTVRRREPSIAPKQVPSTGVKHTAHRNGAKDSSALPIRTPITNKRKIKSEIKETLAKRTRKIGSIAAGNVVNSQGAVDNGNIHAGPEVGDASGGESAQELDSHSRPDPSVDTAIVVPVEGAIPSEMEIDDNMISGPQVSAGKRPRGIAIPKPNAASAKSRGKQPQANIGSRGPPSLEQTIPEDVDNQTQGSNNRDIQEALKTNGVSASLDTQLQKLTERQREQAALISDLLKQRQDLSKQHQDLSKQRQVMVTMLGKMSASQEELGGSLKELGGSLEKLVQIQQETNDDINQLRAQSAATTNAIIVTEPQRTSRPKPGTAVIRKKDQGPSQLPKKRKGIEKDGDFSGPTALKSKKNTGIDHVRPTIDDPRPRKRSRTNNRVIHQAPLDEDYDSPDGEQESRRVSEELRRLHIGKFQELQAGVCALSRYAQFRKCKECAETLSEEVEDCRFKGWRVFPIHPRTGLINGDPWFDHQVETNEELMFPTVLNRKFTAEQCFRMKETVVKPLLPLITRELNHCIQFGAKRKTLEAGTRLTCDRCSMTLFGGSWSCVECGREYCFECESEMLDKAPLNPEAYENDSARLYECSQGSHSRVNLFATTIFELEELQFHWLQMIGFAERAKVQYDKKDVQQLLPNENVAQVLFPTIDVESLQSGEDANRQRAAAADQVDPKVLHAYRTIRSHSTFDPSDPDDIPVHAFYRIDSSELTEALFDRMWRDGIPMVIDNAGKDLSEDWSPQGFKNRFGREDCFVFDCQAEVAEDSTIEDFYNLFDSARDYAISKVLKLKDWPGNTEFKAHCPTLYDDFMQSLPVPDYTRRDGVTNISAFFPTNTTPPDIGPKLYAALRGQHTEGGKGSTRMHMDIADAINVMTYASKNEDGTEGCAVWHVYREQDLDHLRRFLKDKFGSEHAFNDPVHSQVFYLDTKLRKELYDATGITSYQIYQHPGQAVMIPAYCAHQVCNLSDCIKIACDFLSPHSITRCAKITQEFRGENIVSDWKDDVLQLNNMMWYAWLFCQRFDKVNQNSLALPFDETSVGAFIENHSSRRDLNKTGLAHLQRNRLTNGKIPQPRGSKSSTPIWSRHVEIINKVASKPRRGLGPQTAGSGPSLPPGIPTGPRRMAPGASKQQGTPLLPMEARPRPQSSAIATTRPSYQQNPVPYANVPRQKYSAYASGSDNRQTFPPADMSDRTGWSPSTTNDHVRRNQPGPNPDGLYGHAAVVPPIPFPSETTALAQRSQSFIGNS